MSTILFPDDDSGDEIEELPVASGGVRSHDPNSPLPLSLDTKGILSLFECPLCSEYILPPVRQCSKGHILCQSCRQKANRCPVCHEQLGNIRCLFMEQLGQNLRFPCKYASNGCSKTLRHTEKMSHEDVECSYKLFHCPYRFIDGCGQFTGCGESLMRHLLGSHTDNFRKEHNHRLPVREAETVFSPNVSVVDYKSENTSTSWMWTFIQEYMEKMFIINLHYIHNGDYNTHFVTVRMVGTRDASNMFTYKVKLKGPYGTLAYQGKVDSMHKNVKEIYGSRNCLHFDNVTALKYINRIERTGERRRKVLDIEINLCRL